MQGLNQGGKSSDNKLMSNIATNIALEQATHDKLNSLSQQHRQEAQEEESGEDVEMWRQRRLEEMRSKQKKTAENISMRSHGEYREITQDEFLPAVTGSDKVLCHFFHDDFQRCKVLDQHLRLLAQSHVETRFIHINAEKAPFFVERLQIRVLPTMVIFENGVAVDRVTGFEGISREDQFPTSALARLLIRKKAILARGNEESDSEDD